MFTIKTNFIIMFTFDFAKKILRNTIRLSSICISLYLREPCFFTCLIFGQNFILYVSMCISITLQFREMNALLFQIDQFFGVHLPLTFVIYISCWIIFFQELEILKM